MRLLRRRPRARTARPAQRYLARAAALARRVGHNYVGTEHVLLTLVSAPGGRAVTLLAELGVDGETVERSLTPWVAPASSAATIDAAALAALGIDLEAVRERLEETFGPGALEQTRAACLSICPRLKLALAYAVDEADAGPVADEHVLLGMLHVPDSVAARVLRELGVSAEGLRALAS